ncbi:retrovirus-related pol polyprotein from transposon TNT 1-94 [Tanacetum coccineum]
MIDAKTRISDSLATEKKVSLYVLYCSLVVTTDTRHSTAGDRKYWCFTDVKKCLKRYGRKEHFILPKGRISTAVYEVSTTSFILSTAYEYLCCQETLILPVHVNAAITKGLCCQFILSAAITTVGLKPRFVMLVCLILPIEEVFYCWLLLLGLRGRSIQAGKGNFETESPKGYDRLLWGDLITLFELNTGITIHMMVERKYPLTQEMLSRMLSKRLEVDHECEMAYELLRFARSQLKKRLPNINFFQVFGCPVFIHNHKDHLVKFDEKADDGYFLGYSLVSKSFKVFNIRRQQTEETYHIIFDESIDIIKFTKPLEDDITKAEFERYHPDKYLHHFEPSQRYQVNNNAGEFIEPYEKLVPTATEVDAPLDQNDQADQNDHTDLKDLNHQNNHPVQADEILNDDQPKHSNHNSGYHIFDNLPNTKDVQITKPLSSLIENTSAPKAVSLIQIESPSSIPSMASSAPQDRWSKDKHIDLVNIIGNQGVGMLTRGMAKELSVASAHECLFVDFLSKEEPKKVSEALKHPGWVDAMQEELN